MPSVSEIQLQDEYARNFQCDGSFKSLCAGSKQEIVA